MLGTRFRSVFGKLSKTIDCFCWNSFTSDATDGDELETESPNMVSSQSASLQDDEEPSHDKSGVGADSFRGKVETMPDDHDGEWVEIVEEPEEKDEAQDRVGDTPHRVKSKADGADDLPVVEKGMVVKTLAKLSSTGSFVFKATWSLTAHGEIRKDGHLHAGQGSSVGAKNSAKVSQESSAAPCSKEGRVRECSMLLIERSSSDSNSSRELLGEHSSAEAVACDTPENSIPAGKVRNLRSMFAEESSGVDKTVAGNKCRALEEAKSSAHSRNRKETCAPISIDPQNVAADVVVPIGSFDVIRDPKGAFTATIPYGNVKTLVRSLRVDHSVVPDNVIIRKVSSSPKVTVLTSESMPLNNEKPGASELEESESVLYVKESEQPPLLSVQELSKHLSGHVQKMKSLFGSGSS
ncbi:hypothetical protein FGB62_88g031 [Gracilaria domingensis]|nr:hypothetical protein FGB62_88g031 [Gracilaria domingensis]